MADLVDGKREEHLGSGAYISEDGVGGYFLTANHHDPDLATDRVYLDPYAVQTLLKFLGAKLVAHEGTRHRAAHD